MIIENEVLKLKDIILGNLPDGFHVKGSLDCTDSSLTMLPRGLIVEGDLILGNSSIDGLPRDLIVRGNVYTDALKLYVPFDDVAIGGDIYVYDNSPAHHKNKKNTLLFNSGRYFSYFNVKLIQSELHRDDFYQPAIYYYERLNPKDDFDVACFIENKKTYMFRCQSEDLARSIVDFIRAENRGLYKLKGLDLNLARPVEELEDIFKICTGACNAGIKKFEDAYNIDRKQKYTIQQVLDYFGNEIAYYNGIPVWIFRDFFKQQLDISYELE